ncbi:MAG: LytR/AlgR family response regulator transcription factor [Haliscomenobacter sp.]
MVLLLGENHTRMLPCYILDDEPLAIEGLKLLIEDIPYLHLAGSSCDPMEAMEQVGQLRPDVLFLDIEMHSLNGFEFLMASKYQGQVILTSAFPEYAVKGYDFDVLDYLVKPISRIRFLRAVEKARAWYKAQEKEVVPESPVMEDVFIKSDRQYHRISLDDILFIEGLKDYAVIQCKTQKIIASMNLKTVMDQLPESRFARINKSTIINIRHIQKLDSEMVFLEGHPPFTLGRTYRDLFIQQYIESKSLKR